MEPDTNTPYQPPDVRFPVPVPAADFKGWLEDRYAGFVAVSASERFEVDVTHHGTHPYKGGFLVTIRAWGTWLTLPQHLPPEELPPPGAAPREVEAWAFAHEIGRARGERPNDEIHFTILPTGSTAEVGARCNGKNLKEHFQATLTEIARRWPEARDPISAYLGSAGKTLDTEQATAGKPTTARGAPKLEDRLDWQENQEKLRAFEALVKQGVKKSAAAQRVGKSLNTLKEWKRRMPVST